VRRLVAVWERRDHALQAVAGLRGPAVLFLEQLDVAPARERLDKGDARVEFLQPEARQGDLEEITKLGLALPGQLVERPTRPLAEQTPSPVPIGQVGSVDTSRQDVALAPGHALDPASVSARQPDLVVPLAARPVPDRWSWLPTRARPHRYGPLGQAACGVPLRRSRPLPRSLVRRARPRRSGADRPRLGRRARLRLGYAPPGADAGGGVHGDDRAADVVG
jgi:hypothetical protein